MILFGTNFEKGPMLLACNLKVKYSLCCLMGCSGSALRYFFRTRTMCSGVSSKAEFPLIN